MAEDLLLKKYTEYLDSLLASKSGEVFTNGGEEYASQLMSRLFKNTQEEARLYCKGFREDLICKEPYWESLREYLADPAKKLMVLVEEGDHMNECPTRLLIDTLNERTDKDSVQLRLIRKEDRTALEKQLLDRDCNFAVFDKSMFRFEYDPEKFRAFGSFNDPEKSAVLLQVFDEAFKKATPLLPLPQSVN